VCDRPASRLPRARLRWSRLHAIVGLAVAVELVVELAAPTTAPRDVLRYAIVTVAFLAMFRWIAANRLALDLAEWCACAPDAVRVRVVEPTWTVSREPRPPQAPVLAHGEWLRIDELPGECVTVPGVVEREPAHTP
jgi:hypothetical protein